MPVLRRILAIAALALACLAPAVDAAPAKSYTFMLALKRDQGSLERLALRVSAPASGRRGAYLPLAQVERRFGASAATRRAVTGFLSHRGAGGRVRGLGSMVVAKVPGRTAGRLFGNGRRTPRQLRGKVTGVVPISVSAGSSAHPPRAARVDIPERSGTPSGCREGVESGGFTPTSTSRPTGSRRFMRPA
jgi:pro-kumamolisin-like protein